jgi:hypothetical protein
MPFPPNSLSCPKKLSSEYQPYACGNFFGYFSILEKIAILGQPPRAKLKTPTFVQSLCHAQILILEIFHIFTRALTSWRLRLKSSPSLTLNKIERFETGSREY